MFVEGIIFHKRIKILLQVTVVLIYYASELIFFLGGGERNSPQ